MPVDYTTAEAAALLGLKPRSVRALINRKKLTATKRGRDWLVTEEEIARYNRERRGPGAKKGSKLSDEAKRKLSEARKGKNNPFYGKKHTPESLAKIGKASSRQPHGEASHAWKSGHTIDKRGYVLVYMPEHPKADRNYVFEHRLIMEQMLGRYLETREEVHHKNGITTDNRIENLELMTKSEHSRFHRLNPQVRRKAS